MADLSKFSDQELEAALNAQAPSKGPDLSKYSDEELASALKVNEPKMSALDTVKIKGAEGATLGFRPALAGTGAALGTAAGTFSGLSNSNMSLMDRIKNSFGEAKKAFFDTRKEASNEQDKASRDNPKLAMAAELGGSLINAPLLAAKLGTGVKAATGIGALTGAGQAASKANSLGEAAADVAIGAGTGAIVGKATDRLVKGGEAFVNGIKSGYTLPEEAAAKIGNLLTGVPEQQIKTYAKQMTKVDSLGKSSGGDITQASDMTREAIQKNLRNYRTDLSNQVTKELQIASPEPTIELKTLYEGLEKAKARLNTKVNADEIAQIDSLVERVKKIDQGGSANLGDLFALKEKFQELGKSAYMQGGQIFQSPKEVQQASKGAGAIARKLLNKASPEIAEANNKLSQLHTIEDKINKNLITPGNSDAAILAAGSGNNPRNAAMLRRLGDLTGHDALGEAQVLAATKTFAKPSLSPYDATGKSLYRALAGSAIGGTLGGAVGGKEGAATGAFLGGAMTSPAALKLAIKAGKVPMALLNHLTGIAGEATEPMINLATKLAKTPEGQSTIIQFLKNSYGDGVIQRSVADQRGR